MTHKCLWCDEQIEDEEETLCFECYWEHGLDDIEREEYNSAYSDDD